MNADPPAALSETDRVRVPDGTVVVIPEADEFNHLPGQLIRSLKGRFRRDWLVNHAYYCLPLVIGSQMGFAVESLYDFTVRWDGGESEESTAIVADGVPEATRGQQLVTSRFGMGTVTVQNRWTFRTPPGVNLMTVSPPNFWIDGIAHLTAVVEADNLRRDFTFNLKVTRKNTDITIPAGTPIGCVLPYPRHFIDPFSVAEARDVLPEDVIAAEREAARLAGVERQERDAQLPHGIGRRYWRGEDVYGQRFADHQRRLDGDESDHS